MSFWVEETQGLFDTEPWRAKGRGPGRRAVFMDDPFSTCTHTLSFSLASAIFTLKEFILKSYLVLVLIKKKKHPFQKMHLV